MIARTRMEKYEDLYQEAWAKQLVQDKKDNPAARGPSKHFTSGMKGREYGHLGGQVSPTAPKVYPTAPKVYPMSDKARLINRMMLRGIKDPEIAELLGVKAQYVSNIKSRYDLPRHEEAKAPWTTVQGYEG